MKSVRKQIEFIFCGGPRIGGGRYLFAGRCGAVDNRGSVYNERRGLYRDAYLSDMVENKIILKNVKPVIEDEHTLQVAADIEYT